MSKKIYITRKIPDIALSMLNEKGYEVDVYSEDRSLTQDEIISELGKKEYDAVICLLTDEINSKIFDVAPSVKIYANYAAGFNNIDISEAGKRNIIVTNTPAVSSQAVAEHAIALMLSLTTRLVEGDYYMREGKYNGWSPMLLMGTDLIGKTIGLVGVGNIGSRVAKILYGGFGSSILYFDVNENKDLENKYEAKRCQTIEELLQHADIVSLHVPLIPSTHHLINEDKLKLMKPEAFIINTSRGPVIDERALVTALKNNVIKGAALDVFEFEPQMSEGLSELKNVVLTPHIASSRDTARNEMARLVAQNVIDFLEGREPKNKIN